MPVRSSASSSLYSRFEGWFTISILSIFVLSNSFGVSGSVPGSDGFSFPGSVGFSGSVPGSSGVSAPGFSFSGLSGLSGLSGTGFTSGFSSELGLNP